MFGQGDGNTGRTILYAVIDTDVCAARGADPVAVAAACARAGAPLLQLRQKQGSSRDFLALADAVVPIAHRHGTRVIVNDRADICVAARADGVHVGQDDLSVEDVRRVVGAAAIVGLSTHTKEQIDLALDGAASYVAVGPIFGTATKATGYDARGLELVAYAAGRGRPIVAIGGITLERSASVVAAGAAAVAVITDLFVGDDVERRARAFVAALPALPFKV